MIWSGTQYFYKTVIQKLKITFKLDQSIGAFIYLGLNVKQNADFSNDVDETNYINGINPIMITNDRMKHTFSPLIDKEKGQYRQLKDN